MLLKKQFYINQASIKRMDIGIRHQANVQNRNVIVFYIFCRPYAVSQYILEHKAYAWKDDTKEKSGYCIFYYIGSFIYRGIGKGLRLALFYIGAFCILLGN